jgi:hypothetical protein
MSEQLDRDRPPEKPNDYPALLEGFAKFVSEYSAKAVEAIRDEPDISPTVVILASSATASSRALADELLSIYEGSGEATRANAERQLRLSGGLALVRAANEAIAAPGANSKGVLGWLSLIVHFLKKLIAILFPHIPHWLQLLLDFIDELLEALQHLLGGKEASRFEFEMSERWLKRLALINRAVASAAPTGEFAES